MEAHKYIFLELSLTESSGPLGRVGSPHLFCWLKAAYLPGTYINDGRIVVVSRDRHTDAWRESARTVSLEQSQEIIERLNVLGMPERLPDVEGVVDTSDGWAQVSFRVNIDGQNSFLNIGMQVSGFGGGDAERLRELFRYLFNLAGYKEYSLTIYGAA